MAETRWISANVQCYSGGRLDESPRSFTAGTLSEDSLIVLASHIERTADGNEWRMFFTKSLLNEGFMLRQNQEKGIWEVEIISGSEIG